MNSKLLSIAYAALCFVQAGAAAAASESAANPPATVQALIECRSITAPTDRLACFDRTSAALKTATNTGDLMMLDRSQAKALSRKNFGLDINPLAMLGAGAKNEGPRRLDLVIADASRLSDGRLLFTTTDGAAWRQVETRELPADPARGDKFTVEKGSLGAYYCRVAKLFPVQCVRTR